MTTIDGKPTTVRLVASDGVVQEVSSKCSIPTHITTHHSTTTYYLVTIIEQLDADSPVRTAISTFGDSLKTVDGQSYEVEVPKLDSHQLGTAIQWVKDHVGKPSHDWAVDEITNERKAAVLDEADKAMLEGKGLSYYVPLLDTAHYLGIPSLRWSISQCIAQQLKGKSVEEMRRFLNEDDDLSAEEKKAIAKEDVWAHY